MSTGQGSNWRTLGRQGVGFMFGGLGVIAPDPYDPRDHIRTSAVQNIHLPSEASLREYMGTEYDQGSTNACTGYACAEAAEVIVNRLPPHRSIGRVRFSPTWSYWWNRKRSGLENRDGGAYVRESIKAMATEGMIDLSFMPASYDVRYPPAPALTNGNVPRYKVDTYERLPVHEGTPWQIQRILAVERLPVLIGMYVFSQYLKEGIVEWPFPKDNWLPIGSHAMVVLAYKTDRRGNVLFGVTHHWGSRFGRDGLVWIPATVFATSKLVHDVWTFNPKLW